MKLMLDSGAYSAKQRNKEIDLDEYAEFVKENGHLFECCVNLDVIDDGRRSYQNWRYLQRLGLDTMPVYHVSTDVKWLEEYSRHTDYIGLGAIANLSTHKRYFSLSDIWKTYLSDDTGKPLFKVHGMGLTAIKIIEKYPWYSVDSITPIVVAGFGGIFLPNPGKDLNFKFLELNPYKISDQFHHQEGNIGSFLNLGPGIQERYRQFINDNGFELGEIIGGPGNLKKRRRKKSAPVQPFDLIKLKEFDKEEYDGREKTLSNYYNMRRQWNLLMWDKLRQAMNDRVLIYVGGEGTNVIREILRMEVKLGYLTSYFMVTDSYIPRVKKMLEI